MHFNSIHLFLLQFYLISAYSLEFRTPSSVYHISRPFTGYQKQTLTLHLTGKALRTSWHHVDSQPVGQPDNPPACEVASESCKWQAASAAAMAKAKATAVATCSSAVDKNTICQSGKYLWAKCKRDEGGEGRGEGRGNRQVSDSCNSSTLPPTPPLDEDSASVRIMPKFKRPFGPFAGQLPVGPKSE